MLKVGQRFSVFNGDAQGTIVAANSVEVAYRYDHSIETVWTTDPKHFNSFTYPS